MSLCASTRKNKQRKNNMVILPQKREPLMEVVTGMKGVGKTFRTILETTSYMKKLKRKAIVFDVNAPFEQSYQKAGWKAVELRNIRRLRATTGRRVLPVLASGETMNIEEKRQVLAYMLSKYKNGLLVMEDFNNYCESTKGTDIKGVLIKARHLDLDTKLHVQSLSVVDTTSWQNLNVVRFHAQGDEIFRYKDRIPKYELFQIAEFIVNEQYFMHENKRYFVYVHNTNSQIIGASLLQFRNACNQYLNMYPKQRTNICRQFNINPKAIDAEERSLNKFVERKMYYLPKHIRA